MAQAYCLEESTNKIGLKKNKHKSYIMVSLHAVKVASHMGILMCMSLLACAPSSCSYLLGNVELGLLYVQSEQNNVERD